MDVKALAADAGARRIGYNLYLNYCAQCHASDAGGSKGFPNLRDNDWLWGGDPAAIQTSIAAGRTGVMPPFGQALGGEGAKDVANYVMSLSGIAADPIRIARGKPLFAANCAACHGGEGKGNTALGAPNLTDKIWLYGSSEPTIIQTIAQGRSGQMPAWKDRLGDQKIHLLTAYLWGLSNAGGKEVSEAPVTTARK
jgi:cytochrome c oxidase cbb3-type subunit 3